MFFFSLGATRFATSNNTHLLHSFASLELRDYSQIAYGYSRFCELFTYEEWIGFSYSVGK